MRECTTESEYLDYDLEKHQMYVKTKEYTELDKKDAQLSWQLIEHFKPIIQEYYDRGEIRSLLNNHCGHLTDEDLLKYHSPYTIAKKIAEKFASGFYTFKLQHPIICGIQSNQPTKEWYQIYSSIAHCLVCDWDVYLETNGFELRPSKNGPCEHTYALSPFITTLQVSSGKVVVSDNLRNAYPELEDHEYKRPSINGMHGCVVLSQTYSKSNVVAGVCGDSCPNMYYLKDKDIFIIGHIPSIDCEDNPLGINLAHISTDLWWYMLADYDEYLARVGTIDKNDYISIVDIKNGLYEVTHYEHLPEQLREDSENITLAKMKRISN